MKLSDRTYIIILIAMIMGLLWTAHLRFQRAREFEPTFQWPEIDIPKYDWDNLLSQKVDMHDLLNQEEGVDLEDHLGLGTKEQDWFSPDGRIRLVYPAGWMNMDRFISEYASEVGIMLEEAETLLFTIRFDMTGKAFALLTVSQVDAAKNLENITDGISQKTQQEDGEAEITVLSFEDNITWLEIISEYPDRPVSYSKGMVIFAEEKTYLVFFTASRRDWTQLEEEACSIFDSVELLE